MATIKNILKGSILVAFLALVSCTNWQYEDTGLSYGNHDCSMWDYFATQPYDWDSTRVMIEHAGLKEVFDDTQYLGEITFLAPTNLPIVTYLLNNSYKRVTEIPAEICKDMLMKLIVTKRLMVADVPRGMKDATMGTETGGEEFDLADGGKVFMYTYQSDYMGVQEVGEIALYFSLRGTEAVSRIASTDIQTLTGNVQALGYDFNLSNM